MSGFAGMAVGMLILAAAVGLTNSNLHVPLVFAGFIMFNLLMNAGPNSTTFTLAPILFPTQLRATAGGFAAAIAKLGATFGVFLLPILKQKFAVASVLGNCIGGKSTGFIGNFNFQMRGHRIAAFPSTGRWLRKVILFRRRCLWNDLDGAIGPRQRVTFLEASEKQRHKYPVSRGARLKKGRKPRLRRCSDQLSH